MEMAPGTNGTRPRQVLHANAKEGLADGLNELSIGRSGKRERQNIRLHTDRTADGSADASQATVFKVQTQCQTCCMPNDNRLFKAFSTQMYRISFELSEAH